MDGKRWVMTLLVVGCLVALPALSQAKELDIPNFASDPSGPGFTIGPLEWNEDDCFNLDPLNPTTLEFGVTTPESGVDDCLMMSWSPEDPFQEAQAGWDLVFGADPDLNNHVLSLSIDPPWGRPDPSTGLLVNMNSVEVQLRDITGAKVASYGFNTDAMGALGPPVNDFLEGRGLTVRTKTLAITLLWASILVSAWLCRASAWIDVALVAVAVGVTVYLLRLPTNRGEPPPDRAPEEP